MAMASMAMLCNKLPEGSSVVPYSRDFCDTRLCLSISQNVSWALSQFFHLVNVQQKRQKICLATKSRNYINQMALFSYVKKTTKGSSTNMVMSWDTRRKSSGKHQGILISANQELHIASNIRWINIASKQQYHLQVCLKIIFSLE